MTSTYVISTECTTTDEGIINKSDQMSVAGRVILERLENAFYIKKKFILGGFQLLFFFSGSPCINLVPCFIHINSS